MNSSGFGTETIDALGQATRQERDQAGQIVATSDPLGRVTRFEYDALRNVARIIDPVCVSRAQILATGSMTYAPLGVAVTATVTDR